MYLAAITTCTKIHNTFRNTFPCKKIVISRENNLNFSTNVWYHETIYTFLITWDWPRSSYNKLYLLGISTSSMLVRFVVYQKLLFYCARYWYKPNANVDGIRDYCLLVRNIYDSAMFVSPAITYFTLEKPR